MAPPPRLLLIMSLCVLLAACSRAQSEPAKDKKQGRLMSSNGPSYMKRTPLFLRPQRTIAVLLLS
uniref:Lipoprotein n=1 Tax=Heterorhabditis bacteriophora TaxID=37862 RepID=A0A1I7XSK4_HETBA